MRLPQGENSTEPLTEQEATELVERINQRKFAALPPRRRAWERSTPPPVTADDLRDSYRTLKEAHRRRDPELAEWRGAFHAKLEAFLNQ